MIEIKEGIDLDRAVAEAIGQSFATDAPEGFVGIWDKWGPDLPKYSTDLNDAFHAAEKSAKDFYGSVELPPCITVDNRTGWKCTIEDSPEGRGRTPALAICAAILNMEPLKRT